MEMDESIKKDFVTYEQAINLKKLGFREKCLFHYSNINNGISLSMENCYESYNSFGEPNDIDAPTLWEAHKWLRKENISTLIQCTSVRVLGTLSYMI